MHVLARAPGRAVTTMVPSSGFTSKNLFMGSYCARVGSLSRPSSCRAASGCFDSQRRMRALRGVSWAMTPGRGAQGLREGSVKEGGGEG